MEPVAITTPSGYRVTFKPFLTFGDKRRIQRVFMQAAKVDPKNPDKVDFNPAAVYDAQDLALQLLITDIEVPGQQTIAKTGEAFLSTVHQWPEADGQAVYDRLDELTKDTLTPEKKGA